MNIHDDISVDELTKAFNEYYDKINNGKSAITYSELKGKILPGYNYRLSSEGGYGTRSLNMHTGRGGVILAIEQFEKAGLPAYIAQDAIEVFVNGKYHPLKTASVNKSKDNGK